MASAGRMRSILMTATCATLIVALFAGVAAPAGAVPPPPPNPSDQQIQDSQTQASSSAAEVGRLSGLVTSTEGDITRLNDDLELKGELYKKSLIDQQLAQADAATAEAAAQTAAEECRFRRYCYHRGQGQGRRLRGRVLPPGLGPGLDVRPDGCVQRQRPAGPSGVADRDLEVAARRHREAADDALGQGKSGLRCEAGPRQGRCSSGCRCTGGQECGDREADRQ